MSAGAVFFGGVFDRLWSESFWLSNNISWKDLQSTPTKTFGSGRDLLLVVPLAAILFALRFIIERTLAKRVGIRLGISNVKQRAPTKNAALEASYQSLPKRFGSKEVMQLSKRLDISQREVERWIRARQKSDRPSDMTKFCETFWRFVFYASSTALGVVIIYDEGYIWDTRQFFTNHPQDHDLKPLYYIYYMGEMAFYCSLLLSQFFDVRRKDFIEMFVHHIATVILIFGSYVTNFTKIGVVIMLVHDCSDVFLEFAKMAKYAKLERVTTMGFILLAIAFILTRLVILPFGIIRSVLFEGMVILKPFSGFLYFLFVALLLLQILHLYWFSHLLRVTYTTFFLGQSERDTRSDSDTSCLDENGTNSVNHKYAK